MRVTFDELKTYVKNIVDSGKLPYVTILSGGWERWFQMELAVQILVNQKGINLDTESSIVYPDMKRNDIVVFDPRITSNVISYSYEIKCQTLDSSVVDMSKRVVQDIIKSLKVISNVHLTEVVAMFCDWDNMNGQSFCKNVFNVLASNIVLANITQAPQQNIQCVSFEGISSPVSRDNRSLSNVVFVFIDVYDLIHHKNPSEIKPIEYVPSYEIQVDAAQLKYGEPRNLVRYNYQQF